MAAVNQVRLISEDYGQDKGVWSGARVYEVEFESTTCTVHEALSVPSIPQQRDAWEAGKSAIAIRRRARRDTTDLTIIKVTIQYSSDQEEKNQASENPLDWPMEVSCSSLNATEQYFEDVDGNPVANSAGDLFSSMPERNVSEGLVYRLVKNRTSRRTAIIWPLLGHLNNGPITIGGQSFSAGQAYLDQFTISNQKTTQLSNGQNIIYYVETLEIIVRPSWDDVFDDRGLNELVGGDFIPIKDAENNPVVVPHPLDGAGLAASIPAKITRKPYQQKTWAVLLA